MSACMNILLISSIYSVVPPKPQQTSMPALDGLAPTNSQSPHSTASVYQNTTSSTPPKNYTQQTANVSCGES
jgi:hypothetical protein